jgi:hypothetical protein
MIQGVNSVTAGPASPCCRLFIPGHYVYPTASRTGVYPNKICFFQFFWLHRLQYLCILDRVETQYIQRDTSHTGQAT